MISTVAWVPQGCAKAVPERYDLNDEEYQRICELAQDELDSAKADLKAAESPDQPAEEDPDLAEYDMANYDNDEEVSDSGIFASIGKDLAVFRDNNDDPYVTMKNADEEEEAQDVQIQATDNLILAGKTEDDISHLEVYLYDASEDNLYVHHDIMLPAFPLCVEHIRYNVGSATGHNFCAVGTFQSEIELWNLDVLDVMYPHAILGAKDKNESKGKKKKRRTKLPNRHTDAVMALAWNRLSGNHLVSCSADATVKLWDLNTASCVASYEHHTDKVAAAQWNPADANVLLTASYDKTIAALDVRTPDAITRWTVESDVECIRWDPHNPHCFAVSLESGMVKYIDARQGSNAAPLFTLAAHSDPVSALDISPFIPGMMVTAGSDKTVKIWDFQSGSPSMVCSRDVGAGKVFSATFCADSPYLVAVGGSKGTLTVWNVTENGGARRVFNGRKGRAGQVTMDGPGAVDPNAAAGDEDTAMVDEVDMSDVDSDAEEMAETLQEMQVSQHQE